MTQRIVILEGPDRTGKTHIATALSKATGIPYFKNTREWTAFKDDPSYFRNTVRYAEDYFARYLQQTGASVILDRSYPSEWVYSRAMDRAQDDEAVWHADARYAALGADLVLCTRSSYAGVRDDMFPGVLGPERLAQIDGLYREFAEMTRCRLVRLVVDDEDLDRQVAELRTVLAL